MAQDRRSIFVAKWFERGIKESDPFDRFFSLWIALVVAAQRVSAFDRFDRDGDREKILRHFGVNSSRVLQALEGSKDSLQVLAKRRGTRYSNPIVDTGNPELKRKFEKLAAHYSGKPSLSDEALVDAIAELLNKIRNSVFHGVKVYDDREDVKLLEHVNLLLAAILEKCESL